MKKDEFIALCKKHNAKTIFKNHVELSPVGVYWNATDINDIPEDSQAWPVVFDIDAYPIDIDAYPIPEHPYKIRAYAPKSWFPNKSSYRETPFN